jgi:hypothetical protein
MERIHVIIGFIIFIILTATAAADSSLTTEERIVALTLLGEARGEAEIGVYAVGCVIQKRAQDKKLTPAEICRVPWQFSIWNDGKGKIKKESELQYLWNSKCIIVRYAKLVAKSICANQQLNHAWVGNANHYYSKKIMKQLPSWAYKINKVTGKFLRDKNGKKIPLKPTVVIKNHVFYKL